MKNQKKKLLILLLLLLLAIAACIAVTKMNQSKEDIDENKNIPVFSCNIKEVEAFSYQVDEVTYSYSKTGDTWVCDQDSSLALDADKVNDLLASIADITATEELTGDTQSDYGFDEPVNCISVRVDGKTTVFTIGADNEILNQTYLQVDQEKADKKMYLVDESFKTAFSKTPQDLIVEEQESTDSTEN